MSNKKKVYITFHKPVEFDAYGKVKTLYNLRTRPPGFSKFGVVDWANGVVWEDDEVWTQDFRFEIVGNQLVLRIFGKEIQGTLAQRQWAYIKKSLQATIRTYSEVRFPKTLDYVSLALLYDAVFKNFNWTTAKHMYEKLEAKGLFWGQF